MDVFERECARVCARGCLCTQGLCQCVSFSHTGRLQTRAIYALRFWRPGVSLKSRSRQGHTLPEGSRASCFSQLPMLAGSPWGVPESRGQLTPCPVPAPPPPSGVCLLCVSGLTPPLRPHLSEFQPMRPISRCHIHRFQGLGREHIFLGNTINPPQKSRSILQGGCLATFICVWTCGGCHSH